MDTIDDEAFDNELFFLVEAAEAGARSAAADPKNTKRQKLASSAIVMAQDTGGEGNEGSYMAALRGSRSSLWQQQQQQKPKKKEAPWLPLSSRTETPGSIGAGDEMQEVVPDKECPCGLGICLVLTSNTAKNPGRKFYRCPAREPEGCSFFKWCDDQTPMPRQSWMVSGFGVSYAGGHSELQISSGSSGGISGFCFKCGHQGHWARDCPDDHSPMQRQPGMASGFGGSYVSHGGQQLSGGSGGGSDGSCFKCGQQGHWARDCPNQAPKVGSDAGGGAFPAPQSSGTCFKCGGTGHWARDCTDQATKTDDLASSGRKPSGERGGVSCFKCGKEGHWARDCPTQTSNAGSGFAVDAGGSRKDPSSSTGSCFKCGGVGHWARDCPCQDAGSGSAGKRKSFSVGR